MKCDWQEKRNQPSHADDWLITYADMITLLLCFFVLFLIVSISKKDAAHKQPLRQATQEAQIAPPQLPDVFDNNKPFQKIEDFAAAQPEDVQEPSAQADLKPVPAPAEMLPQPAAGKPKDDIAEPKGDKITMIEMNSAAFFDSGSAILSSEGKAILQDVANKLKSDEFNNYQIAVEGHTDDSPIATPQFPSNWELSTARASAVVHFFLDQGILAQKLRAAGYADTFPKAPNRDANGSPIPANQAQNRRVVIKLEKIEKAS